MLGIVRSNLQRLGALLTTVTCNVTKLTQQLLSKLTGALTTLKTQYVNLRLQLALTAPSTSRLAANFTTVVALIKAALTTAKATLIQTGLQLLTIVRQIPQRVTQALKKDK